MDWFTGPKVRNEVNTIKDLYIRVECIDNKKSDSCGGYMCAIMLMLSILLNVSPDTEMEQLSELIGKSDDPMVRDIMLVFLELGDIPKPEVYEDDKQNNVCLYTESEFWSECLDLLQEVNDMLLMLTDGQYSLLYKQFLIDDKDIIYRDPYQIVISKETYEERKDDFLYADLWNACDDGGEDDFEDDEYDE